jgi:hypothetical protein
MKIKFRQSGGFAGLIKSVEINRDDLSEEESDILNSLVEQSKFFEIPEPTPYAAPDIEQYFISVELEGKTREMHVSRANVPKTLKPLIKHIAKMAKYEKR